MTNDAQLLAAMKSYRVLLYVTLAAFVFLLPLLSLWNIVAGLLFLGGLLWHAFVIRVNYLKQPQDYQTRPVIIASLFLAACIIRFFVLWPLVLPPQIPGEREFGSYEFLRYVGEGKIQTAVIVDTDIHGQTTNGIPYHVVIPLDTRTLFQRLSDKGVVVTYPAPSVVAPPFILNNSYLQFAAILDGATVIAVVITFVLFWKVRQAEHLQEVAALIEDDPLGIRDELERLRASGEGDQGQTPGIQKLH